MFDLKLQYLCYAFDNLQPGRLVLEYMHVGRSLGDKNDKVSAVLRFYPLLCVYVCMYLCIYERMRTVCTVASSHWRFQLIFIRLQVRATATVHALIESRGHAFTQSDTHAVQEQLTALLASIQAEVEDTADNTATCFNIIP